MLQRIFSFALLLGISVSAAAASPPAQDPRAVTALMQALQAAGGAQTLSQIQDFTATGTITYFWAGEEVQGAATVRGRAPDQFRLDANLPNGTRSWAVSHGRGAIKETDERLTDIPYYDAVKCGSFSYPLLALAAALRDPLAMASHRGTVALELRRVPVRVSQG